jgi:single-stranded DNA-binding protein
LECCKRDNGDWAEKIYWHGIAVFAPAKVNLIENALQKGTRLRLTVQIRPGSYEDDKGYTKYVVEFVVGPSATGNDTRDRLGSGIELT